MTFGKYGSLAIYLCHKPPYLRSSVFSFVPCLLLCLFSPSIPAWAATSAEQAASRSGRASPIRVAELKTEHLRDPLGIETPHPRFRWLLESDERAQLQTAYQVIVATSPAKLQANIADKWDSGKVSSDNSVEVVYAGRELATAERAYWKVRVWDQNGRPSAYSAPASFEMGLLNPADWQGKWIAAHKRVSSPLFRRNFTLSNSIRRARVYVSGIGYYELSINGNKIGDRVLDPAPTYYNNDLPLKLNSRVLYAAYDVTDALRAGSNAIGVTLGNGFYSAESDASWWNSYGDRPRLLLQLNIELADGQIVSVVSDSSWKTAAGPITYNDLVHGETYDARLEQPGWNQPGFNDASWESASLAEPPSGRLTAQLLAPSRVVETLAPKRIIQPKEPEVFSGAYIYDFGQHFSGWVRFAVSGPRGAKLVLRHGSRLYPDDDSLDTRSNLDARQTDTYILSGGGPEVWEPRFTLHGFRYVEIKGFKDAPSAQAVEGRIVRSTVESTGSFVSSNELLNRIHQNIHWTFKSSLQGSFEDAADRSERIAWLGDPGFVAEDYIANYDMLGYWEKWLDDIRDSQKQTGDVPFMSPLHWRRIVNAYVMWTPWKSTYPELVWDLYQYYGDTAVLRDHYGNVKRLVDFLNASAPEHLIHDGQGDHMEPQENGFSSAWPRHTPATLTSTAYYYYDVVLLTRMADALGLESDAKTYRKLAQLIKTTFNRQFFNPTTNQYATGSQTSNAVALYMDLVPAEKVRAVMNNLLDDISNKHNFHVSTGIIGSNALVQVLPRHGAASLMYKLANQTTYPSLGYQLTKGATTICETYECGSWRSQNMKMLGSVDKFFYRDLAGIRLGKPGYRRVLIQPQAVGDLESVTASQRTVRGNVAVAWIKGSRSFDLKVSIPAGMDAEIRIPTLGLMNVEVTEGAQTVWKSASYIPGNSGLSGGKADSDSIVLEAGSGSYHFTLEGNVLPLASAAH